MSPEQALGGSEPDERSDVYSLGVVLYEMLSGKTPYPEISLQSVVQRHMSEEKLPPLAELRDDVPHSVSDAVGRALAVEPDARFATAREFAEALRLPDSPVETEATGRRRRRIIGAWVVAAALVVVALLWRFAVVDAPPARGVQTAVAVIPFSVSCKGE